MLYYTILILYSHTILYCIILHYTILRYNVILFYYIMYYIIFLYLYRQTLSVITYITVYYSGVRCYS